MTATDARMVAAIRAILAELDWETGDRQYALEAIEQIIEQIARARADVCEHDEAGQLAGMKGSEVGRGTSTGAAGSDWKACSCSSPGTARGVPGGSERRGRPRRG